jgi:hypothetical protein
MALIALPGSGGAPLADDLAAVVTTIRSSTPQSDEILRACQSTWWAPPEYHPGWNEDPAVQELTRSQLARVEAALEAAGPGGALWFDERHCLLFELWQHDAPWLGDAVLVWEPPRLAADELGAEGIGPAHAVALWEYAADRALRALAGRRVFICSGRSLRDSSSGVADALTVFLAEGGVGPFGSGGLLGALSTQATVEGPQQEHEPEHTADSRVALLALLDRLSGAHDALSVSLPTPSDVTLELLDAHRQAYRLGLEARTAWSLAERREREIAQVRADLSRTMAGADLMVSHLLNSL